jgi:hypothetical protein
MVYTGIGDCRAVKPGYDIPVSQYSASMKGLPGMSGGKRKGTRKGKGRKTRKQRGGRYGFFPEGDPNPSGQAWWAGSYAPVQRIACEGTTQNPLNPTHTGSSAPPGAANPNYWMKGQQGGAQLAPAGYGVGNVDSMYYYAPTAGYANQASTWKDSVGAPVQIQVPFAARAMNQACLSTGGHPPLTGALQKGGSTCGTRKNRRGGGWTDYIPGLGSLLGNKSPTESSLATEVPATEAAAPEKTEPKPVNYTLMNRKAPSLPPTNVKGATRTNAPVPQSAPGVGGIEMNAEAPNGNLMGGKRHKKSRKHRKGRKGHKKH